MRVLVTGIGGFVGPVVAGALRAAGHEVLGLVQPGPPSPRLAAAGLSADALHEGDVTDAAEARTPSTVSSVWIFNSCSSTKRT